MNRLTLLCCRALIPWYLPLLLAMRRGPWAGDVEGDVARWGELAQRWGQPVGPRQGRLTFRTALLLKPEFRSLVLTRLRGSGLIGLVMSKLFALVYRPQTNLYFDCPSIGPGLYLEHAFGTVVNAERIGARCWINQQVTIGIGARNDRPTIGDDVMIRAGAIVLGGVALGDGCRVLAGAVVTRDVPPGVSVAGVPARVVASSAR